MTVLAATDWSDAVIAVAGIAMVTVIASIATWQIFATGRIGLAHRREGQYKTLVEELSTFSVRRRRSSRRRTTRSHSSEGRSTSSSGA